MRRTHLLPLIALLFALGCDSSKSGPTPAQPPGPAEASKAPHDLPPPVTAPAPALAKSHKALDYSRAVGFDEKWADADELLLFELETQSLESRLPGRVQPSFSFGGVATGTRVRGPARERRKPQPRPDRPTQGTLRAKDPDGKIIGEFPLQHTDVHARISGYLASVDVEQRYANPYDKPIEAVYVFPLPTMAAVNGFVMQIADRKIVGIVRPRDEAERIYREAKRRGITASLLTQERPNIFTQNVANIAPKERITIKITYFERLKYEAKHYEFVFPTVVAPRYMPGTPVAKGDGGGGTSPDTTQVPDGSKISPPVLRKDQRSGHDISLTLDIDAGMPIKNITCPSHAVTIQSTSKSVRRVVLTNKAEIPNRDFVCRWTVAGDQTQFGVLAHRGELGGFLTLMMQPEVAPTDEEVTPREMTFILDVSGSMNGTPIQMAKEIITRTLDELRREDHFNIFVFAGSNGQLWESPRPRTAANVAEAREFLGSYEGAGGTEMLAGLQRALSGEHDPKFLQMYCFLTDGHVGNERTILQTIKEERGEARFFAFGPGSSVNRFLLDGIGEYGHGMTQYANPRDPDHASRAVGRFFDAIDSPVLVDVAIDWNGLPVEDVYPKRLPDLFAGQTINAVARYTGAARGTAYVSGRIGTKKVRFPVEIDLPEKRAEHEALGPIWARTRIHELMGQKEPPVKQITDLAVDFRLMSKYTAFVAVDESRVVGDGRPLRILQPVELPEGMNRETTVGSDPEAIRAWGVTLQLVEGKIKVIVGAGEIKEGDVIESVNGTAVNSLRHLESLLLQSGTDKVELGLSGRTVKLATP